MYLNSFSVRIVGGNEQGGYVDMQHDQVYSLQMRNDREERCDARVEIDGQHVGTWRIQRRHTINIDRPAKDTGLFTFYRLGSREGAQAALNGASPDLGLVKVTFTPEKTFVPLRPSVGKSLDFGNATFGLKGAQRSAGGTGLSGRSRQRFSNAGPINYDHAQQTVIQLRLVCTDEDGPRPLTAHSTPYPPRLA